MINIALCDDSLKSLENISKIMEATIIKLDIPAKITIVTNEQKKIYDEIKNRNIDVLFLDINFKNTGTNGIDFAKQLRKFNKDFYLIFLTAHFEYSMLSFKCKTFDYILKPTSRQKIESIFERLREEFTSSNSTLFIKITKDISIKASDILFIERNLNKSLVHTKNSVYETNLSLNNIYDNLPNDFYRNHRSYIVNKNAIEQIDKRNKIIYFNSSKSCPIGKLYL